MKKWIFIVIVVFPALLFADVKLQFTPESIAIGQKGSLKIDYNDEIILIDKGFVLNPENNSEIPNYEIFSFKKENLNKKNEIGIEQSIKAEIHFYQSGKQKIRINWKDKSGKESFTETEINVLPTANESENFNDVEEPLIFSGNYIWRLLLIILLITALIVLGVYLFKKWKNQSKEVETVYQELPMISANHFKDKIQELLRQSAIDEKEYLFILTGFIREMLTAKTIVNTGEYAPPRLNFLASTDYETKNYLRQKYKISEEDIQKNYGLLEKKYGEYFGTLPKETAEKIYYYWLEKLG